MSQHSIETITERTSLLFLCSDRESCDQISSDVTIVAGRHPNQERFPVDSFILNIASPKFESLVASNDGEIRIDDFAPSIIKKVLSYIYTDHFDIKDAEDAIQIFLAASYFELPHMQAICNDYMDKCSIRVTDVARLFELSYHNGFPNILSKSAEWLFKRTDAFLEECDLSTASQFVIEDLVKKAFSVNEAALVKSILQWCVLESQRNNINNFENKGIKIRKMLENVLPYLHFLCLTVSEFADTVVPCNILHMDETAAIFSNMIATKSNKLSMPSNLSTKRKREQHYFPLNLHERTKELAGVLSDNHTFSLIFWTEIDCFIEGVALPIIFHHNYQFTMHFETTFTNLKSGIEYKIPSPMKCNVRCLNECMASFQLPCSFYLKKRSPMKLEIKNLVSDVTSLRPVALNRPFSDDSLKLAVLNTSVRTGKYELDGKPLAYIPNATLVGFQISGLLLMF